jgi:hypothetical protein
LKRAFSAGLSRGSQSWGDAPGFDEIAPMALNGSNFSLGGKTNFFLSVFDLAPQARRSW